MRKTEGSDKLKPTISFTCNVDIRAFMTIARFLKRQAVYVDEKAATARTALEYVARLIAIQEPAHEVKDLHEAIDMYKQYGYGDPLSAKRNRYSQHLIKALAMTEPIGEEIRPTINVDADSAIVQSIVKSTSIEDMVKQMKGMMASTKEENNVISEEHRETGEGT